MYPDNGGYYIDLTMVSSLPGLVHYPHSHRLSPCQTARGHGSHAFNLLHYACAQSLHHASLNLLAMHACTPTTVDANAKSCAVLKTNYVHENTKKHRGYRILSSQTLSITPNRGSLGSTNVSEAVALLTKTAYLRSKLSHCY